MDVAGLSWELVIVDNARDHATWEACSSFSGRLPIFYEVCARPGKTAALNHGITRVRGNLVVLTDDDVLPGPNWLAECVRGSGRWPNHVLFGGRVQAEWPGIPPTFEMDPEFGRWTYTICDPSLAEGPCNSFLPVGPNMAVRRRIFEEGTRFNEALGPRGGSYAMGDETEFILRLRRLGHDAVFLPGAVLRHQIRPEQLDRSWVISRAFSQGRSEMHMASTISWFELARCAKHAMWASASYCRSSLRLDGHDAFQKRIGCSLTRGRLYEGLRMKLMPWRRCGTKDD
jgi:GT2 family glycosyltransferase